MNDIEELSRLLFKRIVAVLSYLIIGPAILAPKLGPELLGYEGAFAEDMAWSALPILFVLWVFAFPLFLLFGLAIDTLVMLVGIGDDDVTLR